jgi:predicted nucleic acid-binding protein
MAFVIDSSVALAWLLPDERLGAAEALADRLEVGTPIALSLWPLEVGNALLTARRRDRLTDRDVDRLLEVFSALPVEIEAVPAGTIAAGCRIAGAPAPSDDLRCGLSRACATSGDTARYARFSAR